MKIEEFVAQVRLSIVEERPEIYRELFGSTTDAIDPYMVRAITFYRSLDAEQKEILLQIVNQVTIDTISTIFALIDGINELKGQDGPISLKCGTDELSGELTDRFLVLFED